MILPATGQPTFYPNRDRQNYSQNYNQNYYPPTQNFTPSYSPSYNYNYSGDEPPLCPLPTSPSYNSLSYNSSGYNQSYSQSYNQNYGSPDMFGGFDIMSLLSSGFRMSGSGLELLIILAVYGFRYISVIQQRLKAGDDTLLTQIRETETKQNTELEKVLERLNIFRKETREAHTELSRKIDEVLVTLSGKPI
jgi:hypothetical protein